MSVQRKSGTHDNQKQRGAEHGAAGMDFELVEQPASRRDRRLVLALSFAILSIGLAMLPIAPWRGPVMPHVSGVYGASAAMVYFATFWLLSGTHLPARSHRIIAAAYLYAGLMAVLHVLTFPGALWQDQPLIGNPNTVSWLFFAWRGGFPLFILWAVFTQAASAPNPTYGPGPTQARPLFEPSKPVSPAAVAVLGTALVYGVTQIFTLPDYFPAAGTSRFTTVSLVLSHISVALFALTAIAIWRAGLLSRSLYLWLMPVLIVEGLGMVMSAASGGRYTLGWYSARVEGLLSSLMLLAVLSSHLRQLQFSLNEAVATLRHHTDTLQAEIQRRERAERMLLQSQKLEAVGQLAAGLAHDFNNIMQLLSARMELVRRRVGEAVDADLQVMRRNIRRAEGLTRQLMSFSGRRQLQPQAVLFQNVLPELASMFAPLLRSDISLELDTPPDLWAVNLDPAELEVALANLLTNARDAMPCGGTVTIRVRNERAASQECVALSVGDEGAGIEPAALERVFEPFFTTKEAGKGTGLGLSQVHGFVQGSGGSIAIDSALGKGTVVTLRFPRTQRPVLHRTSLLERPQQAAGERGQFVLLVDDNDDVRESAVLLLEQAGYAVFAASNASHALQMLMEGLAPQVLVTDVVMPGNVDGLGLAQRAREILPSIRIILVSGYTLAADKARTSGFTILSKPYETAELVRLLAEDLPQVGNSPSEEEDGPRIGLR